RSAWKTAGRPDPLRAPGYNGSYPIRHRTVTALPQCVRPGGLTRKGRQRMTETNKRRDLVATLRDALHKLEVTLGCTREGVDEIASQAERLHESVEALRALRPREETLVGIDMLVDAAVDFLAAFRALDTGILDEQAEVD